MQTHIAGNTLAATLVFWTMAIIPGLLHPFLFCIYYIQFGKRKELVARLLERSARRSDSVVRQRAGLRQKQEWQGRLDLALASYIFPILIASVISIAATVVMLSLNVQTNVLRLSPLLWEYTRIATPAAVAGFAGAYIWGLYDIVDRFRTLSLLPAALHMIWFRLLLGPVMGAYAQQLLAKDFAPVMAFALASIPVPSLLKWMQDTAAQRFAIGGAAQVVSPKWELVQGLTPDIISRLNEAGVSSIAHLGNQDPVRLLRLTNIDWRNILDMMDQAYLATYIDDGINKLRARGIRGAIEMAVLWDRLHDADAVTSAGALAVIQAIGTDLGKEETGVTNLVENLSEDPQVQRVWSLWSQPEDDQEVGAEPPDRTPEAERV
jgi:hypothetical protein